jgi:hypothetical protein
MPLVITVGDFVNKRNDFMCPVLSPTICHVLLIESLPLSQQVEAISILVELREPLVGK